MLAANSGCWSSGTFSRSVTYSIYHRSLPVGLVSPRLRHSSWSPNLMSFESAKTLTWKYHSQLFPISFHNTVTLSPPTPYLPPPYSKTITSLSCFPSAVQPPAYCVSRIDVLMQLLSVYVSIPSPKSTKRIRQLIQKNSVNSKKNAFEVLTPHPTSAPGQQSHANSPPASHSPHASTPPSPYNSQTSPPQAA